MSAASAKRRPESASNRVKIILLSAIPLVLLLGYLAAFTRHAMITGDGPEYLAQALSMLNGDGFYLQSGTQSWLEYKKLHQAGITYLSAEDLSRQFKHLCQASDSGCDYNHFWLYSLFTIAIGGIARRFNDQVVTWFSATNFILIATSIMLCIFIEKARDCKKSLVNSAIICSFVFFSTIAWWIRIAHTEVFSFAFLMPASLLISKNKYLEAAPLIAIVSAQNLFWAPIAFGLLFIGLIQRRERCVTSPRTVPVRLIFITGVTFIAALIHPFYYFSNYNILTPQVTAGVKTGVEKGLKSIQASSSFMLDPSNGIVWYTLPIWLIICAGVLMLWRRKQIQLKSDNLGFWIIGLLGLYATFASSQTINFNAGGTYGPSRYGLFIVALSYPYYSWSLKRIPWAASLTAISLGLIGSFTLTSTSPITLAKSPEGYLTKTRLEKIWPGNHDPIHFREPETMTERYMQNEMTELFDPLPNPDKFSLNKAPRYIAAFELPGNLNRWMLITPHRTLAQNIELGRQQTGAINISKLPVQSSLGNRGECTLLDLRALKGIRFKPWQRKLLGPDQEPVTFWAAIIDRDNLISGKDCLDLN